MVGQMEIGMVGDIWSDGNWMVGDGQMEIGMVGDGNCYGCMVMVSLD